MLFVANHTSWIDIELLHSQRAACFVAKAEIARWPLVGWMAATGGTIFHRRGSNHSLASVMAVMVERLRGGRSVAVFPEGGTGYNGVLKVFHARIFQAALDAEVPVQPVALRFARNGRRVIDAGFREHESFMGNFLRLLGERAAGCRSAFPRAGAGHARTRAGAWPSCRASASPPPWRTRADRRRMTLPTGSDFRPPWPLRSGHIQTMLSSSGVRRLLLPKAARTVLEGAEQVMVERR